MYRRSYEISIGEKRRLEKRKWAHKREHRGAKVHRPSKGWGTSLEIGFWTSLHFYKNVTLILQVQRWRSSQTVSNEGFLYIEYAAYIKRNHHILNLPSNFQYMWWADTWNSIVIYVSNTITSKERHLNTYMKSKFVLGIAIYSSVNIRYFNNIRDVFKKYEMKKWKKQ